MTPIERGLLWGLVIGVITAPILFIFFKWLQLNTGL